MQQLVAPGSTPGKRTLVAPAGPVASAPLPGRQTSSAEWLEADDSTAGTAHAVQRADAGPDARLLDSQARLTGPDVEIPALEGALLQTRRQAVQRGLLSQASFDASFALCHAMTQLQPAAAVGGPLDGRLQNEAADAAQQLFASLKREAGGSDNFRPESVAASSAGAVQSYNPYTEEIWTTTVFSDTRVSWLAQLPGLIRRGHWGDAFRGYRRMLDALDLWIADQLRSEEDGADAALGNAHQHYSQLRTGLEQIAGKRATRLPALFHPAPETIESDPAPKLAGDAIAMNVYFWTDAGDGKVHLYDLTTPGRVHEQVISGPPTAATLDTFFEHVARYPEGEVRYLVPGGSSGAVRTTGKTRWYEWLGYAGLAVAAAGVALLTGGASVPATVCFAAGALAAGVSGAGHLVDTTQLGIATTATVTLDIAQVAASFASLGAMSIAVKAGGVATAAANHRWFVPLVVATASADVVQMVTLTDIAVSELTRIQRGTGSPEDKQRATAVLLTQLLLTTGFTALSVRGARNARMLAGQPLELVERSGTLILRVAGDTRAAPPRESEAASGQDLRWQIEHKNGSVVRRGEGPRYPDVDAAVKQGLDALATARARGYPYGFTDRAAFLAFGKALREGVAGEPLPSGGVAVPLDGAAIQGSAVYHASPRDIDVALLVNQEQFDQLIEQSFANQVAKVRARGIDPLRMVMSDATSAAERTLANAVIKGIIKRDDVVPRLSAVRRLLEIVAGIDVDLSVVRRGGEFDHGPYISIP